MKATFHPAAAEELLAAVKYYEDALPSLGRRFYEAVRHATNLAREHMEAGSPRASSGVRRLLLVGFPYIWSIGGGMRRSR